jgi:3-oxoadipate enol-lactonase
VTIAVHESGSGFPILWVHGFPLSAAMYEPQTRIAGFRHIRPDLPGFGDSGGQAILPVAASTNGQAGLPVLQGYARELIAVLDQRGIDRFVLAGFSMGGYIAMQLLRDIPQRIATLLLLDTRETADTDEGRAKRFKQIAEIEESGSTQSLIDEMLPKMIAQDAYREPARRIMETARAAGCIAALQAMAARPDSTETLRQAQMPALVIVGDRDEITPPRDAERMVTLLPHAEMAPIARAAHMANFESSEQVNNLVAAFLGRALRNAI